MCRKQDLQEQKWSFGERCQLFKCLHENSQEKKCQAFEAKIKDRTEFKKAKTAKEAYIK